MFLNRRRTEQTLLVHDEASGMALLVMAKGKIAKVAAVEVAGFPKETLKVEAPPKPTLDGDYPAGPRRSSASISA